MTLSVDPIKQAVSRRLQLLEYIIFPLALGFIFYFSLGQSIEAQFALIDDHQIYNIITTNQANLSGIGGGIVSNALEGGRVRPGYSVLYHIEVALFGDNPAVWHLAFWSYGLLTGLLFYSAVRQAGIDPLSAGLFVLLLTFTGRQYSVWYRLGTGETWGILFLAAAVLALVVAAKRQQPNIWDGVALTFMFLMGTPKESFVLVIPALLLLRIGLHQLRHEMSWRQTLHRLKTPLIAGLLIFIVQMTAIGLVMYVKPDQYGASTAGISPQSFWPATWSQAIAGADLWGLAGLALIAAFILLWSAIKKQMLGRYGLLLLITGTWTLPQLVLYSQNLNGHYLFPLVVAPAGLSGMAIAYLWQQRQWILWTTFTLIAALLVGQGVLSAVEHTGAYTADTQALQKMVSYLAEQIPPEKAIVLVAHPAADYEGALSLRTHLRYNEVQSPIYLLPTAEAKTSLGQRLLTVHFSNPTKLNKLTAEQVGGIVALRSPSGLTDIPIWYQPDQWRETHFSNPFYKVSWSIPPRFIKTDYTYFALLPNK